MRYYQTLRVETN